MPVPNDLSPEEEAAFVEHGVEPAGPGGEPIAEGQEEAAQESQEPVEQAAEPKPGELGSRHRADGTFKNMEELEADRAALAVQSPKVKEGEQPQQGQQQQPKFVPHEALHAERMRSAEAVRQAQLATTRLNALLAAQQGRQPQAQALPDINEDPAGYIQALERRLTAFEQERQQDHETRQIDQALDQDEALFSQQVPDYDQASDYYVQSRARELLAFYPPADAQKILVDEARNIAQQAWQRGMSAAEMVYGLAQARGFAPGNTAASPSAHPIPPRPNGGVAPQVQVAAIKQGQASSRSLSGGGAGAGTTVLNAEALLAMSDDEFEQYVGLGKKGADARFASLG